MTETDLQRRFLLRLPAAIPTLRVFRRNTGLAHYQNADGTFRKVHFGIKGQCDLWGVFDGGRHVEIELKSKGGRLSPAQAAWRDFCLSRRWPWCCLYALAEESSEATVERWVGIVSRL